MKLTMAVNIDAMRSGSAPVGRPRERCTIGTPPRSTRKMWSTTGRIQAMGTQTFVPRASILRKRLSGLIAEWRLSVLLAGERVSEVMDAQFPSASGIAQLRGIVHAPERPKGGLVISHGRSNDLRNPLVRRVPEAVVS